MSRPIYFSHAPSGIFINRKDDSFNTFLCGLWPFLFFTAFAAADVDDAAAAEAAAAAATVTVL